LFLSRKVHLNDSAPSNTLTHNDIRAHGDTSLSRAQHSCARLDTGAAPNERFRDRSCLNGRASPDGRACLDSHASPDDYARFDDSPRLDDSVRTDNNIRIDDCAPIGVRVRVGACGCGTRAIRQRRRKYDIAASWIGATAGWRERRGA